MKCRFCNTDLKNKFLSLGSTPLANSYITNKQLNCMEPFYPLEAYICHNCFLVQVDEFEKSENIFSDYAYFSSYSLSWLEHAKKYVDKIIKKYDINKSSHVVEIASNDGYLLQYFKEYNIPILGIEPAENVAKVAISNGIPTQVNFFGTDLAKKLKREGKAADLLIGNNVLAHVPYLNDFVEGLKILLNSEGIITMEFPHLMNLIDEKQFDTIYHEHFSYFSFITVDKLFDYHGLEIFDIEKLSTHGGSLRIYAKHKENTKYAISQNLYRLRAEEINKGYKNIDFYLNFNDKVKKLKRDVLSFLINAKEQNKTVVGYGAPAKGNTLLNYCGIRTDLIEYTVDISPHKQGLYLPGTHIPIFSPEKINETKPDYVVILPWNLKQEIIKQMTHIKEWGGKFITFIPKVEVL